MSLTKAYLSFISSCVNGLPSWSTRLKGPPTLGFPIPLVDSAMRFLSILALSSWKKITRPTPTMMKTIPAFNVKGYSTSSADPNFNTPLTSACRGEILKIFTPRRFLNRVASSLVCLHVLDVLLKPLVHCRRIEDSLEG
jgi:hypothetical protein